MTNVLSYVIFCSSLKLVEGQDIETAVSPVLHMDNIFGVDLYEMGLAKKVIMYLSEMVSGVGAVRKVLEKYV